MKTGIYATNEVEIKDIIREAIHETNTSMSLLTEDLIHKAESVTSTFEEYNAFMKGAAFIFFCIAKRNVPQQYGTPSSITTVESAIKHIIKLLPFMEESEKEEHLMLIQWLNELLCYRGEQPIKLPKQYLTEDDIAKSIEVLKSRTHRKEDENMTGIKDWLF